MPLMQLLERNASLYPNDVALVELNPDIQESRNALAPAVSFKGEVDFDHVSFG